MILLNWHLFYEPDAGQFYPVTSSLSAGEHLAPQPHFWTSFVWTNFLVARDTTYQRSNLCKNHVGSQFTSLWMIDRAKLKNIIIFSDSNLWRCLKIVQLELQNLEWTLPLTGGSPVRLKLLQPLHFTWEAFTCPSFFTLSGKYEGSPITILVLAVSPCEVTPQTWPISSYLISSMGLSSM